jgi:molecular chaperone DnaK (HSP70)
LAFLEGNRLGELHVAHLNQTTAHHTEKGKKSTAQGVSETMQNSANAWVRLLSRTYRGDVSLHQPPQQHKGTGKSHDIRIEASSGLTQEEIERMRREAEENAGRLKLPAQKLLGLLINSLYLTPSYFEYCCGGEAHPASLPPK